MDFDPTQHTVEKVREYVKAHPEDAAAVVAAEQARTDGTEPRATVLSMAPSVEAQTPTVVTTPTAPPAPPLPPAGTDAPPTAGTEPTGAPGTTTGPNTPPPDPGNLNQQTPPAPPAANDLDGPPPDEVSSEVQAELAGYYDRLDKLNADQRASLELSLDDGTDWSTMGTDPIVRARFGAQLTQAESQITPQTGTFVAPQDDRLKDGGRLVQGLQPSDGKVYDEDGNTVSVAEVRGDATGGGEAQPARDVPDAAEEVEAE